MIPDGHSPLGYSGLERYKECSGSVALIASLPPGVGEGDPEYRRAGSAAHEAWAWCLKNGADAWEAACWNGYALTADDLAAGQVYLDDARHRGDQPPSACENNIILIEELIHAPEIHELAWGTIDQAIINLNLQYAEITDYKHGEGIFVDAEDNVQLMGYACLVLSRYPSIEAFLLRIIQPRCQYAGPREWRISAEDLIRWRENELKPAMNRAAHAIGKPDARIELKPGPWCRFCKVKEAIACPALEQNAWVVAQTPDETRLITNERLGELYGMIEPLNMRIKAIRDEAERRALAGREIPNVKTVAKKADRLWKDTATVALSAALGPDVIEHKLKSPAVIEKLSPNAKALVAEYVYTPDYGLTIAPVSSRYKEVKPQGMAEKFGKVLDNPAQKD